MTINFYRQIDALDFPLQTNFSFALKSEQARISDLFNFVNVGTHRQSTLPLALKAIIWPHQSLIFKLLCANFAGLSFESISRLKLAFLLKKIVTFPRFVCFSSPAAFVQLFVIGISVNDKVISCFCLFLVEPV
jgi:hypothetical protein